MTTNTNTYQITNSNWTLVASGKKYVTIYCETDDVLLLHVGQGAPVGDAAGIPISGVGLNPVSLGDLEATALVYLKRQLSKAGSVRVVVIAGDGAA